MPKHPINILKKGSGLLMKKYLFTFLLFFIPLMAKEKLILNASKEEPPATCLEEDKRYRIEARYQTPGGIGYNTGYSTLEGFFTQPIADSVLLMDARGHVFDDGNWAANAGFGFRTPISPNTPTILGANVYYDYRLGLHGHYNQIALGFEMLKEKWDIRLNGYFPVGRTNNKYKDGFLKFKKHSAYFAQRYQLAMTGGDIELGRYLYQGKKIDLHAALDGYYFSGRFRERAVGGLLKFSSNISEYFHVDAQVSYDSLFKWLGQGTVGVRIPFGKQPKRSSFCSLSSRLYEPVSRFEIIVETKHLRKTVARDPVTGDDLFFVFVDNVRGSSDGSYEHPYPTLLEAQNNSSPGNVLYVFSGDGTTRGMDQGITLKNSQQLLGSGVSHIFSTKFGLRTIPPQTATIPNITNTVNMSNAVTLASNNTVSGFNIKGGTNGNGIRGTGITSAVIDRNVLHGAGTTINAGNMNFNDNADIGLIDVNGNFIV